MRLSEAHRTAIREVVREAAGAKAQVRIFGSRLDDEGRGSDLDLLVELDEAATNPAWLVATIEARITRRTGGRGVDVVLAAPNLRRSPVHEVALREGIVL
ncbi:MAG: nucleotidyltransferase domain-containing protein [Gammaproteobacteria bacterium]|nr:nucleotidyltransferase domain-containing protein [Gammaproteobacteria bacterium]